MAKVLRSRRILSIGANANITLCRCLLFVRSKNLPTTHISYPCYITCPGSERLEARRTYLRLRDGDDNKRSEKHGESFRFLLWLKAERPIES